MHLLTSSDDSGKIMLVMTKCCAEHTFTMHCVRVERTKLACSVDNSRLYWLSVEQQNATPNIYYPQIAPEVDVRRGVCNRPPVTSMHRLSCRVLQNEHHHPYLVF